MNLQHVFFLSVFFLCACTKPKPNFYNITDYGAKGDSISLNTAAIQKALDAAYHAGGGTVIIPPGIFISGTIFIKSHTTLLVEAGAKLLGSPDIKDYTSMTWGHHEDRTPWHLVVAKDAENITICGRGIIDGNGYAFWKKERSSEWHFYRPFKHRPSPMVEIENCKNVVIKDITLQYAAGWCLHPFNSSRVKIYGITIINDSFGPNSDGIDITGCTDVTISDCIIDCGDDAIALKTTEDSKDCAYITVSNCILSTNCVAFRVGFESRKDFRYITFTNSVVKKCSRVIDLRSTEGAIIEHVAINNITGNTNCGWVLNRVIEADLNKVDNIYKINLPEHPNYGKDKPVEKAGAIRHISISNLDIRTDGRILFASIPEAEMSNISLSNIRLQYAMLDNPMPIGHQATTHSFFLAHPDVRGARAAFIFKNISNISLNGVQIIWPKYPVPSDWKLLQSPHRFINKEYYENHEEAIAAGDIKPAFHVLWAKNIKNGLLDIRGTQASGKNVSKTVIKNSMVQVIQ